MVKMEKLQVVDIILEEVEEVEAELELKLIFFALWGQYRQLEELEGDPVRQQVARAFVQQVVEVGTVDFGSFHRLVILTAWER